VAWRSVEAEERVLGRPSAADNHQLAGIRFLALGPGNAAAADTAVAEDIAAGAETVDVVAVAVGDIAVVVDAAAATADSSVLESEPVQAALANLAAARRGVT
jgi:hypothetical protein